jgi:hypothetical protein
MVQLVFNFNLICYFFFHFHRATFILDQDSEYWVKVPSTTSIKIIASESIPTSPTTDPSNTQV